MTIKGKSLFPQYYMVTKKYFLQVAAKKPNLVSFIRRETILVMVTTSAENAIDWEDVYIQLCAFAHRILSAKTWCRGQSGPYVRGKEACDYAAEAIEKYLTHPEKFDAAKGDLLK